jgi:hypothetical protein
MWSFISRLVLRLAAVRWLFKLGGLGLLIPLALLLKTVGLPLLIILAIVGLPILALLFLFGLPIIMVMAVGGMLMGLIGAVLSLGVVVLKFAVLVVLPVWLVWKLFCLIFRKRRRPGDDIHDGPPPDTGSSSTDSTIDPLIDPLD